MPETIPWYKSPLYISVVVSILSQFVAALGYQDVVDIKALDGAVAAVFQGIAFASTLLAERARRKSKIQPLTLRKDKSDEITKEI